MTKGFTLVTPTCDRPQAFALCERWMARQTMRPVQWIVLDDGVQPAKCTQHQEHIINPQWRGHGSLARKVEFVLSYCRIDGDAIAFIEDDDWYAPNYLETAAKRVAESGCDLVGEGRAVYYNVALRAWATNDNMRHASLCQTILRTSAAEKMLPALADENPFADFRMWKVEVSRCVFDPWGGKETCIGMKSLPGKLGYGVGHRATCTCHPDPDLSALRQWIGDDADAYAEFYAKRLT